MVREIYNIYIDYQTNSNLLFNPNKADDKVLRKRYINSIYSKRLSEFNKLFSHLSEQFNNQVDNIGLRDQIKLGIHQNDYDRYIIVYINTNADNTDELPIKELDAYLRILTDSIIDYITNNNGCTKYNTLLITTDEGLINTEWVDDRYNEVSNLTTSKYDGVASLSNCYETSKSYIFDNGWTVAIHLLSLASTKYDNK